MKITPEYIAQLINFYSNSLKPEWNYNPDDKDMRNLQVKGAARIYNLLEEHKLALLADEVGMGKTIQALSVCAALWNEKPDAKILILAPRDEIAKNWEKEYQTFIRHHYRHNDNIVKSISGQAPLKKMIYCHNLYKLVHEVQQGWGQLFIGKISSFSSLMANKDVIEWLNDLGITNTNKIKNLTEQLNKNKRKKLNQKINYDINTEVIKKLKNEIVKNTKSNKPYFDLIIIDEAHYFRKIEGGSLKVNTAKEFFGDPLATDYLPVASKVLLMTATPNHSSSQDIKNIVSYFSKKLKDQEYNNILHKLCVRRLRRLSKHGFNKYNYRKEIPTPSDFKENPLSEMFFGLYQHQLVKEINKRKNEKNGVMAISRMMKYLEGVEFIPSEKDQITSDETEEEEKDESKGNSGDYKRGTDALILAEISNKFKDIFFKDPKHPKYDKLVEDLTIRNNGEKAVVFVRRIPSVKEIAKRIILYYDLKYWEIIRNTGLDSLSFEKLDRNNFKISTSAIDDSPIDVNDLGTTIPYDEVTDIPTSKVLNLFKIIKTDKVVSTNASNFRLRFNHSKPNIFAMFFSPGEDYFSKEYEDLISYRFQVGKEELENYYNSALLHRTKKLKDEGVSKDILSTLLPKNVIQQSGEVKSIKIPTLLTIFWDVLLADSKLEKNYKDDIVDIYIKFSPYEQESFAAFIEKGTLLASEALIWFYEIFRRINKNSDENPLSLYQNFSVIIKNELPEKKLYHQIQESILHFKTIYTKVFSINGEKELLKENWDSFNNAQPIYPYNAKNSNQKVLRCFNTPFYPDILVATSVLQEGVNLQYFCNTIYHYGMAWTPGDNEQRIGRIDRMFGKIERLLEKDKNARLQIYYPYLKDTIDEENMGRFVKRKLKEEILIDLGKAFQESDAAALEENDNNGWMQFLREPEENDISDPFPAESFHFKDYATPALKVKNYSLDVFFDSIVNAIKNLKEYNPDIYFINQNDNQKLLADPTLNDGRKQPVIIELEFDPIGTGLIGESIFCLKMQTPLAPYFKYKILKDKFAENQAIQNHYLPGIKLCLDPSQTAGTNWGLYMSYELPLFIKDLAENPLSIEEIQNGFVNLIKCADLTEKNIFEKDLQKDELNLPIDNQAMSTESNFRRSFKQNYKHDWEETGDYYVLEEESDVEFYSDKDIEKQALIDNHNNFYVKTFFNKNKWVHQVAYLNKDAHKEELNLLEKHFDVFKNNLGW